jgi:PQQ-dependent dehydrogenase (methanol/ethanol family)
MIAGCAVAPAKPGDTPWALHALDDGGQRFSPLAQINTKTVGKLDHAWTYHSGVKATFQATPIVTGGVMYLSLPFSHVVALDARNGRELWRYQHVLKRKDLCCGPATRGVAMANGKVYLGSVDGRLIALDARDGHVLWDVMVADYVAQTEQQSSMDDRDPLSHGSASGSTGVGIGMAPIVHGKKVIVGINGVGYGLHPEQGLAVVGVAGPIGRPGMMAAFDADTGAAIWRFDITGPGWEGEFRNSTPDGVAMQRDVAAERAAASAQGAAHAEAWRYGGGSVYASPVIDAERKLLFFGSGNPSPQMADRTRPGDNLYTSSLIALDLDTGKRVWHSQQIPHDRWGYDVASPPVLVTIKHEGVVVPAIASPSKLGWVYVHDRRDGRLLFKSDAFVPQRNLFTPPQPGEGVVIAPGIVGGANWSPPAFSPDLQLLFVPALHMPTRYIAHELRKPDGSVIQYASTQNIEEKSGTLTALDLGHAGKLQWQVKTDEPLVGGILATAGGLVFSGVGGGQFAAFDAATGSRLWQFQCAAGVNAPPITYALDGRQYIAVAAGGNALFGFKQGDTLEVFALPD